MQQSSKPTSGGGEEPLDRLAVDTIRMLAVDAVENASSGHPGTPLALAPIAYTLWARFLNYDPGTPDWPNRDRFVMSNGHASMLLYSLLHLSGVEELDAAGRKTGNKAVSIDDIRSFRQLDSKTPGHPEYRMTTGVETTTGPLGQGCGNSVGMAIAERWLGAHYNRAGFRVFDHDVYAFCGDGDMMEGVSSEAASLAGHLKLANLCWIYDNNSITIEGHTALAFSEDVAARFKGYGWRTIVVDDANDVNAFANAVTEFKASKDRPTIILVRSIIGYGSPKADSEKVHGSPLGVDAVKATKLFYGWPTDKEFYVPEGIPEHLSKSMRDRSRALRVDWEAMLEGYAKRYPELAGRLQTMLAGELPANWAKSIPTFTADKKGVASRDSGGKVENAIGAAVPWLVGGSADLAPSTKTLFSFDDAGSFQAGSYSGRNLHFGVREHAMGSVVNGMTLSYLRGFSATFLVFSDYMRPPLRLASLMKIPVVFVFTHDSIGVGEDGPTHQPVEQLAALRAMPGIDVIRPGDANEVAEAWRMAIAAKDRPTCLVFSRQALPTLDRSKYAPAAGVAKGAYVLTDDDSGGQPDIILIATGSELSIATDAAEVLLQQGCRPRVVSMPSSNVFERQDQAYRDKVLPPAVSARVAIEQASEFGWDRYVGRVGRTVAMTTFGASAPIKTLQERFGFTVDNVVAVCRSVMAAAR